MSFRNQGTTDQVESVKAGGSHVQRVIAETDAPPRTGWDHRPDYDGDGNLLYEGWAPTGSATSAAAWVIKGYSYDTGKLILTQWATPCVGGDKSLSGAAAWDDRASLAPWSS